MCLQESLSQVQKTKWYKKIKEGVDEKGLFALFFSLRKSDIKFCFGYWMHQLWGPSTPKS